MLICNYNRLEQGLDPTLKDFKKWLIFKIRNIVFIKSYLCKIWNLFHLFK
ncbi:hypothetical protein HanIR_Chr16g0839511 [Helianthus annuus]|nr:hypothetical protein HanIR_Chr16g0839511 [Helianthus annuus]